MKGDAIYVEPVGGDGREWEGFVHHVERDAVRGLRPAVPGCKGCLVCRHGRGPWSPAQPCLAQLLPAHARPCDPPNSTHARTHTCPCQPTQQQTHMPHTHAHADPLVSGAAAGGCKGCVLILMPAPDARPPCKHARWLPLLQVHLKFGPGFLPSFRPLNIRRFNVRFTIKRSAFVFLQVRTPQQPGAGQGVAGMICLVCVEWGAAWQAVVI